MELPQFPSTYTGKEGFEMFLRKHVVKSNQPAECMQDLLLKRDLQDNYINFCSVYGYPIAPFRCIDDHLSFLDITVKDHIRSKRYQPIHFYRGILWSHEACALQTRGAQTNEEDSDSSDSMNQDSTDLSLSSCQDTVTSCGDNEVASVKEEEQLKVEGAGVNQEVPSSRHDSGECAALDTPGCTCWNTNAYTQHDRKAVFEFADFLEDLVALF